MIKKLVEQIKKIWNPDYDGDDFRNVKMDLKRAALDAILEVNRSLKITEDVDGWEKICEVSYDNSFAPMKCHHLVGFYNKKGEWGMFTPEFIEKYIENFSTE